MNEKKTKPRREPTYDGLTHEELARSLGLDELTYDACFDELFGDLLDDPPPREAGRVTQMGPGRRHDPKKKG